MKGRRAKHTKQFNVRLTPDQHQRLCNVAYKLGYTMVKNGIEAGSHSLLNQAIADGEVQLIKIEI